MGGVSDPNILKCLADHEGQFPILGLWISNRLWQHSSWGFYPSWLDGGDGEMEEHLDLKLWKSCWASKFGCDCACPCSLTWILRCQTCMQSKIKNKSIKTVRLTSKMYLCFVCYSGWEVAKIHRCRFIVVGQIIEVVGWGCRKQLQNAAEDTGRAKVTGDICRDGLDAAPSDRKPGGAFASCINL